MNKSLLFCVLILIFHQSFAQTDTVYLNKYRKEIGGPQDAAYYRIIKPQDSVFSWTEYYLNGKVKMAGKLSRIKPDVLDGIATWYSEEGVLTSKGFLKNNKREGHFINYYPDGAVRSDALYKGNALDGDYKFYYPNGQLKRVDIYQAGRFISGKCFTSAGSDTLYYSYLQNPEFIGGVAKLGEYMKAHLVYPKKAIREEITGTVKVKFTVTSNGELSDVHLEHNVHPLLDNEALRLVKNMPRWQPGLEDSKKADFTFMLPVAFELQD